MNNTEWQADVSFRYGVPRLVMWRKVNGQREEREPTQAEYEDYASAEAW